MAFLSPEYPCPHCSQPVKGTAFKGFLGLKSCPHCHKGIKYRKAPIKLVLKGFLIWFACFLPVIAIWIAVFGTKNGLALNTLAVTTVVPYAVHLQQKHGGLDKTED